LNQEIGNREGAKAQISWILFTQKQEFPLSLLGVFAVQKLFEGKVL
jgi:hypothetical protein